jgi:hypothetical protein
VEKGGIPGRGRCAGNRLSPLQIPALAHLPGAKRADAEQGSDLFLPLLKPVIRIALSFG